MMAVFSTPLHNLKVAWAEP